MSEIKLSDYNSEYHFPVENMDNDHYINTRVKNAKLKGEVSEAAYRNILSFLYLTNHPQKITRKTIRNYEVFLTHPAERIMAYRLATRCTESERYNYGINSILATRKARYKCQECEIKDVRCLEIDHKKGRKLPEAGTKHVYYELEDFQLLCANHHKIKTEIER